MFESLDRSRFRGELVGVATGGTSSEREISLKTGAAFAEALRSLDYDVRVYDVATDLPAILAERPAAMVLGIHGGAGESGVLQGMLELFEIPYTGSGVLASALAMDKARSKIICADAGVPVAAGRIFRGEELRDEARLVAEIGALGFPVVVKLNDSGSSVGVELCRDEGALQSAVATLTRQVSEATTAGLLAEAYLEGPEYSVGFFDDECLGTMQIVPDAEFYDFEAKYESQSTAYHLVTDEDLRGPMEEWARRALRALGCRGVARVDFKGDVVGGGAAMLEVNTIPGMTATSLVPKLAGHRGMSFEEFVEAMLVSARLESGA